MGRVLVLGSLNVDLVTPVERIPQPGETVLAVGPTRRLAGGKGANQAVAAAAQGARVTMVGAVGGDEPGRAYAVRLATRGIERRLRVEAGLATGTAMVTVDPAGENAIVVSPGANGSARPDVSDLAPGDVLLVSLEVPLRVVAEAVRMAAALGARVILNAAPYAALPQDVVAIADPLVVNEHEAALLADSGLVPESLLVTFGAAGAQWDDVRVDGVPVPREQVLDTTGAGDAFCGALAAVLANGADRHSALRAATRAGAAAVRRFGAQADPDV
jgi:ribokinase